MFGAYVCVPYICISVCVKKVLIKISVQFRIRYAAEFLINCMSPRTTRDQKLTTHTHTYVYVTIYIWLLALMYAKAKRSGQLNLAALSLLSCCKGTSAHPYHKRCSVEWLWFVSQYIHILICMLIYD